MTLEFATEAILSVMVLGGLAFREQIVTRLASLNNEFDTVDAEDIE